MTVAIIAPFSVATFKMPVNIVAQDAMMGTFITSVGGVIFYQGPSILFGWSVWFSHLGLCLHAGTFFMNRISANTALLMCEPYSS